MNNNRNFVINIISSSLIIYGAAMLPALIAAFLCDESHAAKGMLCTFAVCLVFGLTGIRITERLHEAVRPRIWYMSTFFTWVLVICITVPSFYIGIPGYSLADAVLESSAGWTTTGIGVYDTASMPVSLQLLRSTCNWLGGVGIIMSMMAFVSPRRYLGWGLVSTEFPGPSFLKSVSPFRNRYRRVVLLYAALTLIQFVMLLAAGMPAFTSVLTALSNSSTAGLQHINNGVVTGLSVPLKAIITVFAFLGSVNCTFIFCLINRRFDEIRKGSEAKLYLRRILISALLITGFVYARFPEKGIFRTFTDVIMQTVSFVSTSGYIISDCRVWPQVCIIFILLQMFIGSCAVSTGGGIKQARIIIAFKSMSFSIYSHIHPNSIRTLTYNKKPLTNDQIVRANLFIAMFMSTYLVGALLLTFSNMSVYDALNYSQAMITNTGTSIGELDAAGLAEGFTPFTKYVMCLLMIAGRLEIYPFIMIFLRSFWKPDRTF